MVTNWDDIAERLTERHETQLDLEDVYTEEDFENKLNNLEGGSEKIKVYMEQLGVYRTVSKDQLKSELISNSDRLYNTRAVLGKIQEKVRKINEDFNIEQQQVRRELRQRAETATDSEIRSRALRELRIVNPQSYGQFLTTEKLRGKRQFRNLF